MVYYDYQMVRSLSESLSRAGPVLYKKSIERQTFMQH